MAAIAYGAQIEAATFDNHDNPLRYQTIYQTVACTSLQRVALSQGLHYLEARYPYFAGSISIEVLQTNGVQFSHQLL
jgi:hypothetical protein